MMAGNASKTASKPTTVSDLGVCGDTAWRDVMTKRRGAPPLRFKGRELSRVDSGPDAVRVSITLWARKSRGFTAAVEMGDAGESTSADTLEDAMTWLEGYCTGFAERALLATTTRSNPLKGLYNALAGERALRIIAGEALDRWDQLAMDGAADGLGKETV